MAKDNQDLRFENQKIIDLHVEKEVQKSFLDYAMSVIVSRALPDVRDGMKPVHRRILYTMHEDKLTYENEPCKSATTVGAVLGRYHPHGDTAVYDALVRLAQPFSMRYPLVIGEGNFGNVDGDGAAAYRYTEARLAKLAQEMLRDMDKDVVDMVPNFDNKRKEPAVLPARYPNLLVNGSIGIAVGMATNIPPHNMAEVIDGTVYLIDNPEATVDDLMTFIKGPDFPTYATIYGTAGIRQAYHTGRGKIAVRARAEVFEDKHRIEVYEIPYQVNKSMLVESIADLVKNKRVEGITALRDESDITGMKIVIEYRRDCNGQILLNQLYKYTQLQDTFAVNMVALVNGEPKTLNLKEVLSNYILHQEEVIRRKTKYELERAERRAHILEGLKIAILNIEEVIRIIRASKSISDAKAALSQAFGLDDVQTQAIVEMQLGRLSNLETIKIEEELEGLLALIEKLKGILADEGKVLEVIKNDLTEIKEKYGDGRRTRIEEAEEEIILEDLIEKHNCVITMTRDGYFKRQPARVYVAQNRGGKGIRGTATKEEDNVTKVIVAHSHAYLMLFTDRGKVFVRKTYRIPEAGRASKGTNIVNLVEIEEGEKVTGVISVTGFNTDTYLLMVTKNGTVKKTPISEFAYQRKGGKRAITLDEDDRLLFVANTSGDDKLILATRQGQSVCFNERDVRSMGRVAQGVRGITLAEGDSVCGAAIVDGTKKLITVTENGFGKRTEFDEYPVHKRGGKGVVCHRLTEKTGLLAGVSAVCDSDDMLLVTDKGQMIRFHAEDISVIGRASQGVRVMRPAEGEIIANFATVPSDDSVEKESESISDADIEEIPVTDEENGEETEE